MSDLQRFEVQALSRQISSRKTTQHLILNMNFAFSEGSIVGVLGPSGSGKTSLLRLIAGFDAPTGGRIVWRGECLSDAGRIHVPPDKRRFGMIFQDAALFPHLNVSENVEFGLTRLPAEQRQSQARLWMDKLGVTALASRRVHFLSGGERQRVALARALAIGPQILLLDEPLSHVDRLHRHDLIQSLKGVLRESGSTVIIVTHDARDAIDLGASHFLLLNQGEQVEFGPSEDLLKNARSEWTRRFLAACVGDS